jgi:hypothetical protein
MSGRDAIPALAPYERDVVLVARAIVSGGPYEAVDSIFRSKSEGHPGLSSSAMRVLEDTLAKGCAIALARHGGWRNAPRVGPNGVATARLWELHEESPLRFSAFAYHLCTWLAWQPFATDPPPLEHAPATPADELLLYLLGALLDDRPIARFVFREPALRASPLAWLGFPAVLATAQPKEGARGVVQSLGPAAFDRLVTDGAVVLEALSDDLARRAIAFERLKSRIEDPARVLTLGRTRERTLELLLDAVERKGRWDLVSFLVDATVVVAKPGLTAPQIEARIVRALDPSTPLGDRANARRAAGAHFRALARIAKRHEELRYARHFDDGYDVAQLLLTRWERLGNEGFGRAAEVLSGLEALPGGL